MDLLKKHYEKVLLGVVLLGLAVGVGFLPFKIASEKQKLEDLTITLIHPNVKPLTNQDLTLPESVLKRVATRTELDFGPPNRLFNPMVWEKAADGRLIKRDDSNIGPKALVITNRKDLDLSISLDEVIPTDRGNRFRVGFQNEASNNPREWHKSEKYCKVGDKTDMFKVLDAQAPADSSTNVTLTLELKDGQTIKLTKEKPFHRVEGYTVDVKYPPENKVFPANRRVDQTLTFNGEDYKIVAITTNEIVLLAKSNQKKTTVRYELGPPASAH